ncbi:MAG: glycosyltransferase family 4 protein [Candidatus Zixiibacteriota bacterium]|nr:MAG: glycosyltransferase family 4 protein [candidate division Zixibacteria bacterium]
MRILFLSDAGTYHTPRWVNYFVDRGHRCYLVTLDEGLRTKAEEFLLPAKTLPDFLRYPLSLGKTRRIAAEIEPDLVNAHFVPNYGLIGALLKFHPLVISTWGSDVLISPGKSFLHKLRAEYVLTRADLVTADAEVSARAVGELGVEKERVFVSPMGVEKSLLGKHERKEKAYLLVLSNRRLEPLYDLATLLKAVPQVRKEAHKEVRFVILAEGSQKDQLAGMARELKVEKWVQFEGVVSRETLLDYYRESDVYVSTSRSDSTSVSLLEAMNFGLLPIVTDIPGNREWIGEGKNGFLFPVSDHKSLAERIIYAASEFDRWAEFGEKNAAIIQRKAVWEENMRAVEEELLRLVGGS